MKNQTIAASMDKGLNFGTQKGIRGYAKKNMVASVGDFKDWDTFTLCKLT